MNTIVDLPLLFKFENIELVIHPVVLKSDKGLTMIDCGYPGFLPKIEEAFIKNNLDIKDLKQVVITHCDHDHMGALKALTDKYPDVKILCSKEQAEYITGKSKSLRLEQAENALKNMTGNEAEEQQKFVDMIRSVQKVSKVETIDDGDYLQFCDKVKVISTNGHMPGHISIYDESNKTLISGDALVLEDNDLQIASELFVLDKDEEIKSLKKLQDYEINEVICYHGGIYSGNIKDKLKKIIEKGYN